MLQICWPSDWREKMFANRSNCSPFLHVRYLAMLLVLFLIPQVRATAAPISVPSKEAGWLETLNYYRLSSGVDPVTENPAQSAAALKHSIYLAKSDPKYFSGQYLNPHTENPSSPYYTLEGANSGTNLTSIGRESDAIDSWMQAPLHAIGLLRDNLKTTGYATALNERTGVYHTGLDVINGLVGQRKKIITFPGDGSSTRLYKFTGESPDPRESCGKDWKEFRGLPIFASFLSSPSRDITGKVVTPSGNTLSPGTDLCIVSEYSWVSTDPVISYGIEIIRGEHMVLVIPKSPLAAGKHSVTLSGSGMAPLNWSFTVLPQLPEIQFKTDMSEEKIYWDSIVASELDPVVGFTVVSRNRASNQSNDYHTKETFLQTTDWPTGDYWVCVKVRSRSSESECSLLWGYTIDRKPRSIDPSNFNYTNPKEITWSVIERPSVDAKIKTILIRFRQLGADQDQITKELSVDSRSFQVPILAPGNYEVCVQVLNSYGTSSCYWRDFEVITKVAQRFTSLSSAIVVGKSTYLWPIDANSITLANFSPKVCSVQMKRTGIKISGLKPGKCDFQVTAIEDEYLLPYKQSYSLTVTKSAANSKQVSTIKCANEKSTVYISGVSPTCPTSYKKVP